MTVRGYCYTVILAAIASVLFALGYGPSVVWQVVLFLGPLALLAEWLAFPVGRGYSVSISFALGFAATLLGGPVTGALVALFSTVSPQDITERKPPYRVGFNAAQMWLATLAAGFMYVGLGGTPLLADPTGAPSMWPWIAIAVASAITLIVANMVLVGAAISLDSGVPISRVWRSVFKSYALNQAALALLGLVLAQLVAVSGVLGVLLLIVPFAVARQTFAAYRQLSEAYRDTLRSLVTLIEAKDPYTRGHSERVAVYARGIADSLEMSQTDAQSIEYAALLHDVGKVGISVATLTKPGRLTTSEYDEVKLHPVTAARVLINVELLEDTLPLIEAHHERLDGSGYPLGLDGGDIPMGAKVLAVADSFDAMTSTRAYRSAMSHSDALVELESESGVRLSTECVVALREAILAGEFAELHETGYDWDAGA